MRKMLFQKECLPATAVLLFVCLLLQACRSKSQNSPQNYDLDNPHRIELGKGLSEISGICFNEDEGSLLAIADNKEKVFQINFKGKKLEDYTGKIVLANSDLEDVVKVDTTLFLLMSRGTLVEVPQKADDTTSIKTYDIGLSGSNDFEALYYDSTTNGLILLCKTCFGEAANVRTAYRFDLPTRTFDSSSIFTIDRDKIKKLMKNNDAELEPSAAAINPINKRLYILSSSSKMLVITDTDGELLEGFELNPDLYPQAEGIAFAPNGDMYISNEGKNGPPTLLRFNYMPNRKKN